MAYPTLSTSKDVDIGIVERVEVYCSGRNCSNLVYTTTGIYESDRLGSTELLQQFEVGKGYVVDTNLKRIPILGWYVTILRINEIY